MAVMAGKDGEVQLTATKIGYIDNFSLAINQGSAEVSQLGDQWKQFIGTARDWSGSFSGTLDYADSQQKKIVDDMISGVTTEPVTLKFKCNDGLELTGTAILTSMSITGSHADKVAVSVNFQGNGPLSNGAAA